MKYSKIKFLVFFAIICSIGLTPINDAFAATIFVDTFSVTNEEATTQGIAFNSDGTKMFVVGQTQDFVNEYACTTGYDVSTCSYSGNGERKSVTNEDATPTDLEFNTDGTKMFVVGFTGKDVNEYACTTGYDVSTCVVDAGLPFSVTNEEATPQGIAFNSDGTKMFVVGDTGDDVNEYACTTGYDVSTCSYSGDSERKSVSAQNTAPTGIAFNSDGTKMFVTGTDGDDDVNEYACTTGYDVSTCSFTDAFSVSSQESNSRGVAFNSDGTKMFVVGTVEDDVNEYTLSVGFDLNISGTTTFVDAFDISDQDTGPQGVAFNSDGTKMFVLGNAGDDVNEYACSTAFDVSTCVIDAGLPFSVTNEETIPSGFTFNTDGTKMFVTGFTGDDVNEYACTTGFDVSTCSFTVKSGNPFSVATQETRPSGVTFNSDGTKMFVTGTVGDAINEYACTTGFDVSTCSFTVKSGNPFSVSTQDTEVSDVTFNSDGTKMFVLGTVGDDVNEYACTTGFDVSTCSFTDYFSVAIHDTAPTGVTFNSDGTKMFVLGATDDDVNEYTLEVGFDFNGVTTVETTATSSSSDCYDCISPTLQMSHITISSNDYVIATGDDPLHITAHVGDKVTVILNVTDNKSIDTIPFAGLYTNFQEKPNDMSAFYANNYNNWKHVSTSFYEWNVRADDVAYNYEGVISWSDNFPTVVTGEITDENYFMKNDDNVLEYFMMPFTFTMNDSMEESAITAKIYDMSGNRLHVTLPVTLAIIAKEHAVLSDSEEIAILDKGDVIVTPSEDTVPLLNETVLLTVLSQWSGYSQEESTDAELLSSLGLQGESLPAWTKNLGEWVIQEKLDVSELIMAINYVNDI